MRSSSEKNLRLSLNAVADLPQSKRVRVVSGKSSWKVLSPSWQGLLIVAIQETPIPDSESSTSSSPMMMRNRKIGRRGGKARHGNPLTERLESVDELIGSDSPAPYRLASFLTHKTLKAETWDSGLDGLVEELRQECMKGVHPVWGEMAEKTPILAQFAAFPVLEVEESETEITLEWIEIARIDPADSKALGQLLSQPFPIELSAVNQVEIRRLATGLSRKKRSLEWLQSNVNPILLEMESQEKILSALLLVALGDERSEQCLSEVATDIPVAAELVGDLLLLMALRNGGEIAWPQALKLPALTPLEQAITTESWSQLGLELGRTLTLEQLKQGKEWLDQNGIDNSGLDWSLVVVYSQTGEEEKARTILSGLKITRTEHFEIARSISEGGELDGAWMEEQIEDFSALQLSSLVEDDSGEIGFRIRAAELLLEKSPSHWRDSLEMLIPIFASESAIEKLTEALQAVENAALEYPWEVILVHHLHPATASEEVGQWLQGTHEDAVNYYEDSAASRALSELSITLLRLLEGSNIDMAIIAGVLSKDGFKAFKQCCHSLEETNMMLRESELSKVVDGVAQANISIIERKLFDSVVENATLNRAAFDMQRDEEDGDADRIENLVDGQDIRHQLLLAIQEMVLEHYIAVPSLIPWYQDHAPTSVNHLLARAAVAARNGKWQEAGRIYSQAGNRHDVLEFDQCTSLLRTSLIHFAHAKSWKEASNVLKNNAELSPSLTPRFKLYLQVQFLASSGQNDAATNLLLEDSKIDVEREIYNDDNELESRMFIEPSLELLDRLMGYPISRNLPVEPFQGRVRAAMRNCEKQSTRRRRSKISEVERSYNELLRAGDIEGLYALASEQSEIDHLRGLALLDRAIHSKQILSHKVKMLKNSMLSLYQRHSEDLAVYDRRLLRNLSLQNLVIVDTNILIDALQRRLALALEMSSDIRLDLVGHRHFHHMLLHFANEKKIALHVTTAAEQELHAFCKKNDRLRALFKGMHISAQSWKDETSKEKIAFLIKGILKDFNTWRVPRRVPVHKKIERSDMEKFLFSHLQIYEQLTDFKLSREHGKRTKIGDHEEAIFPEQGDIEIMLASANFAGQSLPKIGSIVVASQDSDFTHVTRAFEDEFGFTVAKNTKQLRQLLLN